MSRFLQESEDSGNVGFGDSAILDEFELPFGEWMEQAVFWIDNNMEWALDGIKWPFETLLDFLVGDILETWSWLAVVLIMGLIGWLVRNLRVGLFAVGALTLCGLLGPEYWQETARTIGFIFVAVLLCVIIGIPVGIACGRVDPVWNVVRPILDAMQVVHSFVYMLPFIFFFSLGEVSATMVTMVFALPPLIRLTNLGIRQVPEDVVEASRSYGAPEFRVLTDVQIPLARPAIMTGVNQTLLLAISMLGIAAIMGAGGLGRLMFNALSSQDVARGASAGLAFFLVAVTLDRISQPVEGGGASLMSRIRAAWAHRADPESLLIDADDVAAAEAEEQDFAGHPAPVAPSERLGLTISAVGSVVAILSVFLTWSTDSGRISSHARFADEALPGNSYSGLAASGGTWFGVIVLLMSAFTLLAAGWKLTRIDGPRYMSADGAVFGSFMAFGVALAFWWADPGLVLETGERVDNGAGIGLYLALLGTLVASVGAIIALRDAPYAPHRLLTTKIEWFRVVGAGIAVATIFAGTISGWSFDVRSERVLSEEQQARIEELTQQAEENPALSAANAVEISSIFRSASATERKVTDSWNDNGTGLGPLVLLLAVLGGLALLPAAGVFGRDNHKQWRWSAITMGVGLAVSGIGLAWIISVTRVVGGSYFSGVGAFLTAIGGFFLFATGRTMVSEFYREEVFDDEDAIELAATPVVEEEPERQPA